MTDLERYVVELQRHGVSFWLQDGQLKWHSVAALKLTQVLSINRNRAEITDIIRKQLALLPSSPTEKECAA